MIDQKNIEDIAAGRLLGWPPKAKDVARELLALRASHEELRVALQELNQLFDGDGYCGCGAMRLQYMLQDAHAALANAQKVREG